MRITSFGQCLFAAAIIGMGVLGLFYDDFALQWQPLPAGFPARGALALIGGALMVASGAGLLFERTAKVSAVVLGVYLAIWVPFKLMPALDSPTNSARWLGVGEGLALALGAWILYVPHDWRFDYWAARLLFGLCCLSFGVSHFVYADFTAAMIPAWMPQPVYLAWITGAGHCLAGVALLIPILPRLAATLEAAMMSSFVLLLHLPSLWWSGEPPFWGPDLRTRITLFFVAMALSASAWCLAHAFHDQPWGLRLKAVPAS
jgi:uncharacterized membrane protein